jgi:hypothetical protein
MDYLTSLLTAGGLATLAMLLLSLFKDLIESIPGAHNTTANKGRHDSIMRLALLALNVGCAFGLAAILNRFTVDTLGPLIIQALLQAGAGHEVYQQVTRGNSNPPQDVRQDAPSAATDPTQTQNGLPLNMGG